ncbi:MAG: PLP-dependent transferase [bacterium]
MSEFPTQLIHAGREKLANLGVHALPLDRSTTYPIHDLTRAGASLDALAHGEAHAPDSVYQRLYNPTVGRFEDAMAALEGTEGAVAFATGMAAVTACILAAKDVGNHIVAIRPLYGGSDHLLSSGLLGVDVTFAEADDFHLAIRPDTAMVILETPANPTLDLVDIEDVVARAGDVAVLVDSTFATPVLQNPVRHGATLVLHSATKYIGGHGDVMGGVVAANEFWCTRLRGVRVATGALLEPRAAYDLHRGLQTLGVRMLAAQANAMRVAEMLAQHPAVNRVYYPSMSDGQDLVAKQMRGPGAMVAFEVHGGYSAARRVVESVRLITPAVSLGSADSLIQHPASLTHRVVDEAARNAHGIVAGLVRMSVGLEDADDLIADLRQALGDVATTRFSAMSAH